MRKMKFIALIALSMFVSTAAFAENMGFMNDKLYVHNHHHTPEIENMAGDLNIQPNATGNVIFFGGLNEEGNIGIGTESPSAKLDVQQSSGGAATIGSFGTATGNAAVSLGQQTIASGNYSTAIGSFTEASGIFSFAAGREIKAGANYVFAIALDDMNNLNCNQANSMCIMGGKVGIGVVDPDSALEVAGEIHITDINTGGNAGDALCIDTNGRVCACGTCA